MEEDLIKKAIARDVSALEALYDHYAPALLSVCFRYCGNRDDAEDILHDGFIKIIGKIQTFKIRSEGSLEAWMRRIMVNTALNFLRSRLKERSFVDIDPILEKTVVDDDHEADPEEIFLQIDREQIMELICELPAGYRTVFNLYVFEEYGHKEIAQILECSENTSKSQLSKARALLRKKMNQLINVKISPDYEKV
ncbi:MAG: RNA polymerase sigma factor [Bacteroidales bacterium]|nr:RNA polymerase sigma factor [Bacteroidales bacterium]